MKLENEPERRSLVRRKQFKSGIIAFNNRHSALPCSVRDMSEGGARLEAPGNTVPDTFELLIEIDGLEADCRVVWRRLDQVGVAFIGPARKRAPRRAQVIDAIAAPGTPSLRKKPIAHSADQDAWTTPRACPQAAPQTVPQAAPHAVPMAAPVPQAAEAPVHETSHPPRTPKVIAPEPAGEAPQSDHARACSGAEAVPPAPDAHFEPRWRVLKEGCSFPAGTLFRLAPVLGLPASAQATLCESLDAALAKLKLGADASHQDAYVLNGCLVALHTPEGVRFTHIFDITDARGRPVHRINGEHLAPMTKAKDLWSPLVEGAARLIAGFVAGELAQRMVR
jgi:hypothetical protein